MLYNVFFLYFYLTTIKYLSKNIKRIHSLFRKIIYKSTLKINLIQLASLDRDYKNDIIRLLWNSNIIIIIHTNCYLCSPQTGALHVMQEILVFLSFFQFHRTQRTFHPLTGWTSCIIFRMRFFIFYGMFVIRTLWEGVAESLKSQRLDKISSN